MTPKELTKRHKALDHAERKLRKRGIDYQVLSVQIGLIRAKRSDGREFSMYTSTGEIPGFKHRRGINDFISLIESEVRPCLDSQRYPMRGQAMK